MTVTEAALRADPNFRRYLGARVVSAAGTLLIAVVLPVLVYRVTGSLTWTSAAVVASALPHLLLGVPAVELADRWDRRRILVGADLGRAAALLSVPAVWLAGGGAAIAAWHLLAVVFVLLAAGAGTLTSPRGGFAAALVVLVVGVAVAWRPLRAAEGS